MIPFNPFQLVLLHGAAAEPGYADISFVGAGTRTSDINAMTVPWPSGHQAGDYALLHVETAGVQVSTPSGWGLVGYIEDLAGASDTAITVFDRVAESSSEANASIADTGDHQIAVIAVYRGVASRLAEVGEGQNNGIFTTCPLASITTTVPKTRVVYLAGANGISAFSSWVSENLIDIQERVDYQNASGDDGSIGIADGSMVSAGSVGAGTLTAAVATRLTAITVGLVPAVV